MADQPQYKSAEEYIKSDKFKNFHKERKAVLMAKKMNKHPKDYKTNLGNGRSDAENRASDIKAKSRESVAKWGEVGR